MEKKTKRVISRMCFCRSLIITKEKKKQKRKCKMENQRKAEKANMYFFLSTTMIFCIGSKWKHINLNIKCTQDNCNCNNNCTLYILLLNGNVHCALCWASLSAPEAIAIDADFQ